MTRSQWYGLGLVVAVLASGVLVSRTGAAGGAQGPTVWEYQTASVETGSLATKLMEFGRDGWEVFSIVSTDATVDTGADGKPHVVNLRVEVTAKRPKMP